MHPSIVCRVELSFYSARIADYSESNMPKERGAGKTGSSTVFDFFSLEHLIILDAVSQFSQA